MGEIMNQRFIILDEYVMYCMSYVYVCVYVYI